MAIYDYQGNEISVGGGGTSYDWSNKKIVFEGDSITSNIGFPEYIANNLGATSIKISQAGFPVMGSYPGYDRDFRKRISNIPYNADAIVIMGDINNHNSNQSDATDWFTTDITKWAGRVNVFMDSVKRSFPTVPVFLVPEYGMGDNGNTSLIVAQFYEIVARRLGCIYVCPTAESGFSLSYAYPLWGLNGSDKVHAKSDYVSLWAECILNKIKTIKPPVWADTDSLTIDSSATVVVGSSIDIGYTAADNLSLQWTSSDYSIACVMGGKVYGIGAGTATITAKTHNGNTATCTVTVTTS